MICRQVLLASPTLRVNREYSATVSARNPISERVDAGDLGRLKLFVAGEWPTASAPASDGPAFAMHAHDRQVRASDRARLAVRAPRDALEGAWRGSPYCPESSGQGVSAVSVPVLRRGSWDCCRSAAVPEVADRRWRLSEMSLARVI